MTAIRVLIADDETLMRSALRMFVESADDMTVVGEAVDGLDAVAQNSRLHPDVILMDMQMPKMDGVEATRTILIDSPTTRVLAVTTFSSEQYLVPALRAGASAYLVKDTEPEALISAIREVHDGSCVISPSVTRDLIESVRTAPDASAAEAPLTSGDLTDRELDVVRLLAQGLSNAEIAAALFLSEATVKTHLGRVMARWGVRDRVQTLIRAVRSDIVELS